MAHELDGTYTDGEYLRKVKVTEVEEAGSTILEVDGQIITLPYLVNDPQWTWFVTFLMGTSAKVTPEEEAGWYDGTNDFPRIAREEVRLERAALSAWFGLWKVKPSESMPKEFLEEEPDTSTTERGE